MVSNGDNPTFHKAGESRSCNEEAKPCLQHWTKIVLSEVYQDSSWIVLGPFGVVIPSLLGISTKMPLNLQQQELRYFVVLKNEISLTLDVYHNWQRKGFAESKNESCCYKQTLQRAGGLFDHLDDSWLYNANIALRLDHWHVLFVRLFKDGI